MLRIVVIDDHSLVRQGLRAVLAEEADFELVGEAETAAQALALLERTQPDVALLDLTLPDRNGLEVIPLVKQMCPKLCIIVLTIHDSELYLVEAMNAGASGYLLKDSAHTLIPLAIRAAVATGCLVEKRLIDRLLRALPTMQRSLQMDERQSQPQNQLSERELAVLRLISQGSSNRSIADQLFLAESTVKKYVHSLKSKLSVNDRAQAAVIGVRLGLVD